MSTLASLNIQIGGNSATLRKELTKARKSVSDFTANARTNVNKYGKATVASGVLVVGALAAIYKQQSVIIDQTAKFADSIGIGTAALTELRYAADLSGVSNSELDKSLENMTRRTAEAAFKGTGPLADTLNALNINAQDLNKLKPDEQLGVMADALVGVESQSERTRIAYELFGKSGIGILKMVEGGSQGIATMRDEAVELGISLDRVDANKVEMANDAITRSQTVWSSFSQNLATEAAPVIGSLADLFMDNAKAAGGMGKYATEVVQSMVSGAGFVGDAWRGIQVIWQALKVSFNGLKLLMMEGAQLIMNVLTGVGQYLLKAIVNPIQLSLDAMGYFSGEAQDAADKLRALTTLKPPKLFDDETTQKAYADAKQATTDLHNLMMEPIPSDNLDQWYESTKDKFDSLATSYVSTINQNTGPIVPAGSNLEPPTLADVTETENPYASQIEQAQEYFQLKALMRDNDWSEEKAQLQLLLDEYATANELRQISDDEYRLLSKQATDEFNAQALDDNQTFMESLKQQVLETSENYDAMWGSTFDRFTEGVGSSVATAVMTQQSFSDSMKTVLQGIAQSTIAALTEMGVKRLALWATEKTINKATATSSAASLSVQAQAMALMGGLNAYSSTAAIPVTGAFAAPGAMAAALAITQPTALAVGGLASGMAGMAHDGIDNIPAEGTWLLDKGERVVDSRTNQDLKQALSSGSVGNQEQSGVTVHFNVTATDSGGFDTWYRSNRNMIIADVSDAVRSPA